MNVHCCPIDFTMKLRVVLYIAAGLCFLTASDNIVVVSLKSIILLVLITCCYFKVYKSDVKYSSINYHYKIPDLLFVMCVLSQVSGIIYQITKL
jgi:FlaA1/EpsC-like NDP-sugar epimerase